MAETRKGRKLSEEHKKNIGKAGKGRKITEETREKMSKVQTGKIISEEQKKKISKIHSTPKMKQISRERLRKTRHNQQKPNKQELEIKKILTDVGLIFNHEQNLNKFIQSSNESNFGMFINIPFSHSKLQQKFKETDFLIPPNKIIEHNGTYDHADHRKYSADTQIRDKIAGDIWKKEKMILDSLKKEGYEILVIWQMDLEKNTENIAKKILKFVKS
jgi:G:T-mismatch repair DNA endonuclease (very short patch repair protein)